MAYALMVDDVDGFVNRAEVRAEVDKLLGGATAASDDTAASLTPEEWSRRGAASATPILAMTRRR